VVALYHLNEIQGGMLLSGAADGSVRVWRNFSHRGAQRLASAWRVSGLRTSCALPHSSPACYKIHRLRLRREPEGLGCLTLRTLAGGTLDDDRDRSGAGRCDASSLRLGRRSWMAAGGRRHHAIRRAHLGPAPRAEAVPGV